MSAKGWASDGLTAILAAPALAVALTVALTVACARPASADAIYPTRAVRLIVPSSPGSGVDIVARLFAQKLTGRLGQQVIVDNRAGAGANIGAKIAAGAPPDGYTLFIGTPAHVINESLYSHLNYNLLRDFLPVSLITTGQYILVVHPSVPVNSVKELIAFARARPGALSFASGGAGNASHLAAELFNSMARIQMVHVPYKGTGPALTDMIAGQEQLMFANLVAVLPHMKSRRLRALATTGEKRTPLAPQLPTISEAGLPGYSVMSYSGIFVPAGTPAEIVTKLNAETVKVMAEPELRAPLADGGADPTSSTPEQFASFLRAEIDKWGRVIVAAKIHAD